MTSIHFTASEENDYLRKFIETKERLNENTARKLHARKGVLATILIFLRDIEAHPESAKATAVMLQEQIQESIDELREIGLEIFDHKVAVRGLEDSLESFLQSYRKIFKLKIEYSILINDNLELPSVRLTGIYDICTDAIRILTMFPRKKINVRLLSRDNGLEIEVSGRKCELVASKESIYELELEFLKGKICWQNVFIYPETDWRNLIKIRVEPW